MNNRNQTLAVWPGFRLIQEWRDLSDLEAVEVRHNGVVLTTGRVDEPAQDGDIVWIFQDHGKGRVLFHSSDGVDIFNRAPDAGQT